MFSLVPRCHGLCGLQKNTGMLSSAAICTTDYADTPWTASVVMMAMLRSRPIRAGWDHPRPPAASRASSANTGPTREAKAAGT